MSALVTPPQVIVTVDGAPLSREDARSLGEVRVQQRLSLPTLAELRFFDPEGSLAKVAGLTPGASLRISVEGHGEPLFDGQVTAMDFEFGPSRGREVRVRGYDRLHQLRKRQPVRAHVQVTLEELARELVTGLGVSVQAAQAGPVWRQLVQHGQSDLELLSEVAERCGLYFTLREDRLHILTLEGEGEGIPLALGRSLLEARCALSAEPACRTVATTGWDPWRVEPHFGQAHGPRVGRRVPISVPPERVGGSGECTRVDQNLQSDAQAEALAQAELDRRVAGEVALWGVADGNPSLRPGARVEVEGVAAAFTGRYVLTSVTHTIDRRKGFISELDTAPPERRAIARSTLTTTGIVTQVEDPDGLGRVRVSLPSYGEIESEWLEVVIPGAGAGKGIIALPDVDDQVLVLFPRGDPAQGVVLGGLYGVQEPPDTGVEGGAVRRYTFLTPGGQRVRLDDEKETVRVENSGGHYLDLSPGKVRLGNRSGSYLELTGKRVRLHAAADLEIEAPGRAVTIRGQSIDFERG